MGRVTAVFDDRTQAERAISALRSRGIPDRDISIVARRPEDVDVTGATGHHTEGSDAGGRIGKGALAGAGVGTLFGLAAALIPGIGPFIAAGTLATALGTTGGAAAAGAIVGGTSGAIAGAFSKAGYSKDEAEFYAPAVEKGAILVAVDTDDATASSIRTDLSQFGAKSYGATGTTGTTGLGTTDTRL